MGASVGDDDWESDCCFNLSIAECISSMVCQRSAGFLRRHRSIISTSGCGVCGASSRIGCTSSRMIAAMVEIVESRVKPFRPVTISYSTMPREKMSDRASTVLASACSGDI